MSGSIGCRACTTTARAGSTKGEIGPGQQRAASPATAAATASSSRQAGLPRDRAPISGSSLSLDGRPHSSARTGRHWLARPLKAGRVSWGKFRRSSASAAGKAAGQRSLWRQSLWGLICGGSVNCTRVKARVFGSEGEMTAREKLGGIRASSGRGRR